jgi:hypothetical protein
MAVHPSHPRSHLPGDCRPLQHSQGLLLRLFCCCSCSAVLQLRARRVTTLCHTRGVCHSCRYPGAWQPPALQLLRHVRAVVVTADAAAADGALAALLLPGGLVCVVVPRHHTPRESRRVWLLRHMPRALKGAHCCCQTGSASLLRDMPFPNACDD